MRCELVGGYVERGLRVFCLGSWVFFREELVLKSWG